MDRTRLALLRALLPGPVLTDDILAAAQAHLGFAALSEATAVVGHLEDLAIAGLVARNDDAYSLTSAGREQLGLELMTLDRLRSTFERYRQHREDILVALRSGEAVYRVAAQHRLNLRALIKHVRDGRLDAPELLASLPAPNPAKSAAVRKGWDTRRRRMLDPG